MEINTGIIIIIIGSNPILFSKNGFYNMVQLQRNNRQMQPVALTIIMSNYTLTLHSMSALMCQVAMTVSFNAATNLSMWNKPEKENNFRFSFFFLPHVAA